MVHRADSAAAVSNISPFGDQLSEDSVGSCISSQASEASLVNVVNNPQAVSLDLKNTVGSHALVNIDDDNSSVDSKYRAPGNSSSNAHWDHILTDNNGQAGVEELNETVLEGAGDVLKDVHSEQDENDVVNDADGAVKDKYDDAKHRSVERDAAVNNLGFESSEDHSNFEDLETRVDHVGDHKTTGRACSGADDVEKRPVIDGEGPVGNADDNGNEEGDVHYDGGDNVAVVVPAVANGDNGDADKEYNREEEKEHDDENADDDDGEEGGDEEEEEDAIAAPEDEEGRPLREYIPETAMHYDGWTPQAWRPFAEARRHATQQKGIILLATVNAIDYHKAGGHIEDCNISVFFIAYACGRSGFIGHLKNQYRFAGGVFSWKDPRGTAPVKSGNIWQEQQEGNMVVVCCIPSLDQNMGRGPMMRHVREHLTHFNYALNIRFNSGIRNIEHAAA